MRRFVKIKSSRNGEITLSCTDIGKSCPSRQFLTLQICLLALIAKTNSCKKIPDLQYSVKQNVCLAFFGYYLIVEYMPYILSFYQCEPFFLQAFTDPSDLVSRRMGLTPLPLACLLFKILSKTTRLSCWMSVAILFVLYFW